jgi:hypothetical protein
MYSSTRVQTLRKNVLFSTLVVKTAGLSENSTRVYKTKLYHIPTEGIHYPLNSFFTLKKLVSFV